MVTAYAVIFIVSLGASLLTFFSGFGLGTILMPVMALYFDVKVAIAATAVVHFGNGLFKGFLLYKKINVPVFLQFALPAIAGSFLGAYVLTSFDPLVLAQYNLFGAIRTIQLQELLVALLMLVLCVLEWLPDNYFKFSNRYVVPGGFITGFAGGFTGMQGALRSSFLINLKFTKEEFVATGSAISLVIDFCRIIMYMVAGKLMYALTDSTLVLVAIVAAMAGAFIGLKMLKKTTFGIIKIITTICIVVFSFMLGGGLLH